MRGIIPGQVNIREVGPRDGFQMEKEFIPTELKANIIKKMVVGGLKKIEATSFVHPRAVSQLSDAEALVELLGEPKNVVFSGLVVNEKGLERAIRVGISEVVMVISASETHSLRNVQMGVSQALCQSRKICALAEKENVNVRVAVAVAFGCPFEREVPFPNLKRILEEIYHMGIRQVTLADTAGLANPIQVREITGILKNKYKDIVWGLHFHDTRGLGLTNIYAGLEEGVSLFETSIGGLGGCPFIPRATGNVATEDLVNMLLMMGVETGIDLAKLLALSRELQAMLGRPLPSRLLGLSESTLECNGTFLL